MDLMQARRRLLTQRRSRLPSEYQEVEYIETDRLAYIDSLISLGQSDFEINCNFELLQYYNYFEQPIFSIWTNTYNYWNCFVRGRNDGNQMDVYTRSHHTLEGAVPLNEPKQVTLKRNSDDWLLEYNNKSINWTFAPIRINDTTIKLFKRGDLAGTPSIRIYNFILKIDGNLSANFIPCYRKSDSEIGMYDTVSKTFYTNAGTGTFTKGAST